MSSLCMVWLFMGILSWNYCIMELSLELGDLWSRCWWSCLGSSLISPYFQHHMAYKYVYTFIPCHWPRCNPLYKVLMIVVACVRSFWNFQHALAICMWVGYVLLSLRVYSLYPMRVSDPHIYYPVRFQN